MFDVIWYDGWIEYIQRFDSRDQAIAFIDATGMDTDEFDIVETEA